MTLKNCASENLLLRFVEGDLSEGEFAQVDRHVESCEACQGNLERITHDRVVSVHESPALSFLDQFARKRKRQNQEANPAERANSDLLSDSSSSPEDYRIERELGRGGMGIVYRAEQISLGREVALKVIPHSLLDDDQSIQRFELEARTAAQLQHEHIVPVYEVGAADNYNWYSMRLIEGKGLDQVIKSARSAINDSSRSRSEVLAGLAKSNLVGQLDLANGNQTESSIPSKRNVTDRSLEQTEKVTTGSTSKLRPHKSFYHAIATVGQRVADALSHAHENGVVHRDIKPSNLLLDQKGKVWVADFGLAKKDDQELTRTGDVVGTLRFMSPERLDGINDRRGDIYSLGMTLYELLALGPAFEGVSQYNVIEKIRNQSPVRLKTINSAIPRDLVTIIEKAIEKDPARRYASAQVMAEDLELFLAGRPIRARRVSQTEHLISWAKRNPGIASALGGIFLLVVTGLIGTSIAALQFREMAIEQGRLTDVAERESNENQQNLYYAEMKLGTEAGQSPYGRRALQEILGHWIPQDDTQPDRRGFEWYWLNSMLHPNAKKFVDQAWDRMQFSSEGKLLCRAGSDAIEIANWPEFEELWTWFPDERPILKQAKLDSAFKRIAILSVPGAVSAETEGTILQVLDWKSDKKLFELNEGGPQSIAWKPDGTQLAVLLLQNLPNAEGPKRHAIKVYSTVSWSLEHEFDLPHKVSPHDGDIEFSKDGKWLAINVEKHKSVNPDGTKLEAKCGMLCIDTKSWNLAETKSCFQVNWSNVRTFAWHPERSELAFATLDGSAVRWDVSAGTVRELKLENWAQSIEWDSDGDHIIVAGDGAVRMLDSELKPQRHWMFSDSHTIFAMPHSVNDDIVVAVALRNQSRTYRLSHEKFSKRQIPGPAIKHISHSDWEGRLLWNPNGKLLASSLDAGTTVWEVANGKPWSLHDIENLECTIIGKGLGWISDDELISTYCGELSTYVASEKKTWTSRDSVVPPVWGACPNQLRVASPFRDQSGCGIKITDAKSGEMLRKIETGQENITAIALSKDGKLLAHACVSGSITIRDTDTFEVVAEYQGHTGKALTLSWSPDGKRLASGGLDSAVRLWDTSNGKQVVVFKQLAGINAVAWSPEGQRLATINLDGYTTIYDATTGYEAAIREVTD